MLIGSWEGTIFQGRCNEIININMCWLIESKHTILIQCHGKYIEVEKPQLHPWNWYFKKSHSKIFARLEEWYLRVWVSKWHPDALLAETMTLSTLWMKPFPEVQFSVSACFITFYSIWSNLKYPVNFLPDGHFFVQLLRDESHLITDLAESLKECIGCRDIQVNLRHVVKHTLQALRIAAILVRAIETSLMILEISTLQKIFLKNHFKGVILFNS